MVILDLDDFHETNTSWELLLELKDKIPAFKVTLFSVLGRCSEAFIKEIKKCEFIDMVPHGFLHISSRECENWDYRQSCIYLGWASHFGLTHGFKSPGWLTSDGMYKALDKYGYWIADQSYNNDRRPRQMPVYLLHGGDKIHGHIGHVGGHNANELSLIMPEILKHKDQEFAFVKDCLAYA